MKIGARIIKTGVAVTITMFICNMLNLEPAFFGAVSAIVNMQPSILLTIETAKDQIKLHVLGVSIGLICGYTLGSNPIIMGLVTILIIYLHIKINFKSSITMGIIAALFVLNSSADQFLPHAFMRTAVIFVGLGVAMLINIALFPPRYQRQIKEQLKKTNQQTVHYFCQAIQDFVQLENNQPPARLELKESVHKMNEESRKLINFMRVESDAKPEISASEDWLTTAEKLIDYNQSLLRKADRVYELLPARFERRMQSELPPITPGFRAILELLESSCNTITRVNEKLLEVIIDGKVVEPEKINEQYWKKLTHAIEQWQTNPASSYYVHALLDVAVTANEIKWASREAKKLLADTLHSTLDNKN